MADTGATVSGSVLFSNLGPEDATAVSYTFSIATSSNDAVASNNNDSAVSSFDAPVGSGGPGGGTGGPTAVPGLPLPALLLLMALLAATGERHHRSSIQS